MQNTGNLYKKLKRSVKQEEGQGRQQVVTNVDSEVIITEEITTAKIDH